MLLYGNKDSLSIINPYKTIIYNITSLYEGLQKLHLIPPNSMGHLTDRDFDLSYANYIMTNDIIFSEFFKIIYYLYEGKDVFLVFSDDEWSENLLESLLKLIQQRYGINGFKISNIEDYDYACKNCGSLFNIDYGIYNLDIDKERFIYLLESFRIQNGGSIHNEWE